MSIPFSADEIFEIAEQIERIDAILKEEMSHVAVLSEELASSPR